MLLAGNLQDVDEAVHLDVPSQQGFGLGNGREQGGEVVDGVDVVLFDDGSQLGGIGDIGLFRRAALEQHALGLSALDVTGNNSGVWDFPTQFHGKLRANLARGANDENILHFFAKNIFTPRK